MIDLSGIARHLRLSVDQLRVVADLLQQGYQPGFIERYRADETGNLPRASLWLLKHEIDRQLRLQAARERAADQLPKDAELDAEAQKYLARATTEVEIEATLRAFRARRQLSQHQENDKQASQLLEKLIEYQGPPIADLDAWVAQTLELEPAAATAALQQAARLVGLLMHSDTGLHESLRRLIQRKAVVRVEFCEPSSGEATDGESEAAADTEELGESHAEESLADELVAADNFAAEAISAETAAAGAQDPLAASVTESSILVAPPAADASFDTLSIDSAATSPADAGLTAASPATPPLEPTTEPTAGDAEIVIGAAAATEAVSSELVLPAGAPVELPADSSTEPGHSSETPASETSASEASAGAVAPASTTKKLGRGGKKKKEAKAKESKPAKKPVAKMTPRQRRRRWLIAMLQPLKSLKSPLTKLSSYQMLMLGRGRRSQLIKTNLQYDRQALVALARDTFVTDKHPLAAWFRRAADEALEHSLRSKVEADAVNDLEEVAAQRLLENSVDQLRQSLMQRPVRGHCILVIDAVGPKAAAVAIIDPSGQVLAIDEIPCSATPAIVMQNVTRLGELVHQYRVSLVALTNGPARRFLVLTLRELMTQSASSGLRWTMADRSGADAYAVSRSALKELSIYNRRHRAAIWVGRSLQDPLSELLKVDVNRLRLGSFQRELPQEPLKHLVRETLADCVCQQGIDTLSASVDQLMCVPGVSPAEAQQIAALAAAGRLTSRKELLAGVSGWSERDARQAIGVLRVYGSEQPLDATTIHPDDYRLAERLIEHTELSMPPAAPEGWQPPQREPLGGPSPAAAAAPSTGSAGEESHATPSPLGDETSPAPETAATEIAAPETAAPETAATETAASESVALEPAAPETAVAESTAAESTAVEGTSPENVAADSGAVVEAAAESEEAPVSATEPSTDGLSWPTKQREPLPQWPKPEYPEEVVTLAETPPSVDVEKLARGWQVGREKLRQIASCLHAPFADPRLARPPVPLMTDMPTLHNLQPGACVWAVVIGVADFGAFVELAPDCSGLIHISRLSPTYIEDPHQCVQVGDLVMAWVVSVDEKKNRVALTALSPEERAAAEAAAAGRRAEQEEHRRRDRGPHTGGGGQRGTSSGQAAARGGQPRSGGGENRRGGHAPAGGRGRGQAGPHGGQGRGKPRSAHSKSIVVTSKQPKANITDAMKEGEEPLRSFSDLMQFYQAKRTDPTPPTPPETSSGE